MINVTTFGFEESLCIKNRKVNLGMTDSYGRRIDYIRISVTDRCDLRCRYCMPEEGVPLVDHESILRYSEIVRLGKIFASLGISKIKLTGGEPLARRELWKLAEELKKAEGIRQVTLTTNGTHLKEAMAPLAAAGIDGINMSLDTLDEEEYFQITRRRKLDQVLEGFYEALKYPEIPLKINCVPLEQSEESLCRMAELARDYPVHVRFIEMMPIGLGHGKKGPGEEELRQILENHFRQSRDYDQSLGNGPARYIQFEGFQGKIGFISAVSHRFCSTCNRIRLTSQGYLKTCLQYETGADLREPLRQGASDEELRGIIEQAVMKKPEGHTFFQKQGELEEKRIMSQIGG